MSLVRVVVVLVWCVLIGVLVHQNRQPREEINFDASRIAPSGEVSPADEWMGVYINDKKIGYTRHHFDRRDDGYRFTQESLLRLSVMNTVQTVRVNITGDTDAQFALRNFDASLRSGVGNFSARGRVEGKELLLDMKLGAERTTQRVPLSEPIFLPTGARRYFSAENLQPGKEVVVQVFDPSTMQYQPMKATMLGREELPVRGGKRVAWKVREQFRGVESMVWLDESGNVLREQGPLGMVAIRETAEQAIGDGWDSEVAFDLMAAVAVPVKGKIENPRALRYLELRIDGIPDFPIPSDARQQMIDGRLIIRREALDPAATYQLPYSGEEWRADLAATAFLQIDHPRVQSAAAEVLQGEKDALRAARRLNEWVYEKLRKVPTASIPNALQVLEMEAGDCNEHAVLFAALARAAGLPARVVAGAVYMDEGFLYHAWNEVWLGDGWVSVDPTFGQMPVDATHIKLVEGGPEVHDALLRVIGRLSLDVIKTS